MNKVKRIYWCVQQLDRLGGTEQVSIDLMNHLSDSYQITLVCTCKTVGPVLYDIDKRIQIINLGVPSELGRFDQYSSLYLKGFKLIKFFRLFNQLIKYFVFKRKKISLGLEKLIDNDESVLICSSLDSYLFAPKKGKVFFHFHFNAKSFFSLGTRLELSLCRKPDKYIFLSKSTLDIVKSKKPKIGAKSLYIYNPIRFQPSLDLSFHNNTIIFAGRFSKQKNPYLALQIADILHKEKKVDFQLKMFGEGSLEPKMRKYLYQHHLENCVHINKPTPDLRGEMEKSDILLITSIYEGFILVKGEAAALSRPCISSNWGDTVYEMFHLGEDGFIIDSFKPEDYALCLEKIFLNPDLLIKLKEGAYHSSLALSFENIIPKWKELLS